MQDFLVWVVVIVYLSFNFLQYDSKEDLYQHIVECDVIIYDITEDPEQIDKAVWIISGT